MNLRDAPPAVPAAPESGARDYERVAAAIRFLERNAASQPDLSEIARRIHLSEHHFQRLFTRWAGVSPKRFLQFLTVEHAKARLAASRSLLDIAGDVGLSGPGRLHDLFVTLEAMSPGEARAGGAGLAITYGVHDSPFGPALVATTPRGVCGLHFVERDADAQSRRLLASDWPNAVLVADPGATRDCAARIFDPISSRSSRPLALLVPGTNFQLQVWRALLRIPSGCVLSYGDVAGSIGQPLASRAVGRAVGANPVAWLIPCHRVIRETGTLGRYRWGAARKAAMLGWEAAHAAP
jgi:AraC family transcriptional regulator of adaptative response/methylated-DNA-[protein]-cysteine methyltransferase